MALKRLPNNVQSLLCATAQVNNFKTAVEELVYNSLDAESTSTVIRININESTIQVIDNGSGITKHDFNALGQRYMTSKFNGISTIKAAPKSYGYRGEFLASIITVSQIVKITSRHGNSEETWAKTFHNGKEKKLAKITTRPTKGTTVDIKGFLYNQNIQKRSIDPVNELQDIKLILNQLSLAHNNISFSLRDDSKNEIVFKIHKKRDIYQTLTTLFDINKTDLVELHVEKHEYKVKGLIGKANTDHNLHWIYLNGKYIHSCKLHKIINEYFKKSLNIKEQRKLKSKKNKDEEQLFNQNYPFYFIFVTCPYIDYDISFTSKQSVIEFKSWEKINKLLEKLIKFYVGDVNLKEIKPNIINKEQTKDKDNQDTRVQVKQIMDKILGSNSKKIKVSQLQNGVKGKLIKRKKKKPNKNGSIITAQNNCVITSPKRITETSFEKNDENQIGIINKNNLPPKVFKARDKKVDINDNKKIKIKEQKERKAKDLPPTRKTSNKRKYLINKQKNSLNKLKNLKVNCAGTKMLNIFKESDSVCKKSKVVAQRAEFFLQHHLMKRKTNVPQTNYANGTVIRNDIIQQTCGTKNVDNIRLPPKINKYIVNKFITNKLKANSYKTTYDLVQTILKSQQVLNVEKYNLFEKSYSEFSDLDNLRRNGLQYMPRVAKRYTYTNKYIFNSYSNSDEKQEIKQYTASIPMSYNTYDYEGNVIDNSDINGQKESTEFMYKIPDKSGSICNDIYSQSIKCRQNETMYYTLHSPYRLFTYDSHQCNKIKRDEALLKIYTENSHNINTKHNMRFITKQSRENFVTSNDFRNKIKKRQCKMGLHKHTNTSDIHTRQTIEESYSVQYSKSNENNYNIAYNGLDKYADNFQHKYDVKIKTNDNHIQELPANDINSAFGNTYTIQASNFSVANIEPQNRLGNESYEPFNTYSKHYSNSEINENAIGFKSITKDTHDKDYNIVFVSKPQFSETTSLLNSNIEPLNVCETIYDELGTVENEFAFSFNGKSPSNDSLYDNCVNKGCVDETLKKGPNNIITHCNDDATENVSHHFSNVVKTKVNVIIDSSNDNLQDPPSTIRNQNDDANKFTGIHNLSNPDIESNCNVNQADAHFEINNFNLRNRPRFVPKGMSQIFENCRPKPSCDYNLLDDYYENDIYDNFINDVQVNSEIYEPIIQNVEDLTTKNIHKFQNKVKKDNASLVFDQKSLKEAKVLGQADCKFIAAIMKKQCDEMEEATEYLILFDQHAAHERIRLENNLADYIDEDRWTSVPLDNIILKMSKDEILYLHNYKDKFVQLGLNWTILSDNEVTINSIPEAILGKNPREVEKVIKAVKNLIIEEINVIKLQKGCLSLYPKSIMDLVFNEACRYAIKFGDQLTKNDCVELIKALSDCKTPFQCAHGRPVMAVLMDIKHTHREYKINMEKLKRFKTKTTMNH